MKILTSSEEQEALKYIEEAAKSARRSMCQNRKCGAVIVKGGVVIGRGYNAPPLDKEENRTCNQDFGPGKPKFDRTCCMHAEWRAIIDALKTNSTLIKDSKLYFTAVDSEGNIKKSGKPCCTVCSRMTLDVGCSHFVLWHEGGVAEYPTDEYDKLSYLYRD